MHIFGEGVRLAALPVIGQLTAKLCRITGELQVVIFGLSEIDLLGPGDRSDSIAGGLIYGT